MPQNNELNNMPRHVGIIMDGNGRWAKKRSLPRIAGHREGAKTVRRVVKTSGEVGIEVLTLYAFSTENWKRPKEEVSFLMNLLIEYLFKELDELIEENVKLRAIGDLTGLPLDVQDYLQNSIRKTTNNTGLILNLALNYGGRDELMRAIKSIYKDIESGTVLFDHLSADLVDTYLDTASLPDPDLIIRTSGEIRLSNFLLWQGAYSELWFTETLWPDFTKEEYLNALKEYSKRSRRFGKV
ncbi:MAG: isoprenyl transferase [Firmicutes bacterium]|nr:isoprenyl transferase [Bacillota bacterium]MDD4693953.1 isoprenyl transferase [Bacillota bacterium]